MPGVGAYLVLPPFSAAMHASLMCSGVSKSGSPAAKPQTSSPAACKALALASTASVGDGETLRAQVESGAGDWLMRKTPDQRARLAGMQGRRASSRRTEDGRRRTEDGGRRRRTEQPMKDDGLRMAKRGQRWRQIAQARRKRAAVCLPPPSV